MTKNGTEKDSTTSQQTELSKDATTSQILGDIAQTRSNLGGTLEQLQEKLAPSALKEKASERVEDAKQALKSEVLDARDAVRDATLGKVEALVGSIQEGVLTGGRSVLEVVKANPVPLALTGVGLAWLVMNARRGPAPSYRRRAYHLAGADPYDADHDSTQGAFHRVSSSAGRAGRQVSRTVAGTARSAQASAASFAGRAGDFAQQAQDSVRIATRSAGERAERVADDLREQGSRLADHAARTYWDNPLVVGAAVAVVGAVVGLALPVSQREKELLSGTGEHLMRDAQHFARGALDKVQQVALQTPSDGE